MITDPLEQAIAIGHEASKEIEIKYMKGQEEHGGNFFAKPTIKNIREEVLDLMAYTHVLGEHKVALVDKLESAMDGFIHGDQAAMEHLRDALELARNL